MGYYLRVLMINSKCMEYILLMVDDDVMIQKLHSLMVKRNEFADEFFKFENGQLALDFLKQYDENQCFIVFLDINMPIMNGWEFMDAINKELIGRPIFVAIVSSSVDSSDFEKANTYPQVLAYIDKPLNNNALQLLKKHPKIAHLFQES